MATVEARRTLVKSAPELWAELSDADALGRRLESLGEIRISRLEPQTTVAWEGERARGTVTIEPTGFGTRVILTAEPSEPAAPPAAPGSEPETREPEMPAESSMASPEDLLGGAMTFAAPEPPPAAPEPDEPPREPRVDITTALEHGFDPPAPQPPPRRAIGRSWLLGRLMRRRGAEPELPPEVPESPHPTAPEPPALEPAPEPMPLPEPSGAAPPEAQPWMHEPEPSGAAPPEAQPSMHEPAPLPPTPASSTPEPPEGERAATEQAEPEPGPVADEPDAGDAEPDEDAIGLDAEALDELLAGVLDDLGAAHHRPFSRG